MFTQPDPPVLSNPGSLGDRFCATLSFKAFDKIIDGLYAIVNRKFPVMFA